MKYFPIDEHNLLTVLAIAAAALAALILIWYLVRRPALVAATRIALLFGLGLFPLAAAIGGNVQGYKATQQREFCGSCHVMGPHANDAKDPSSKGLAAIHTRNHFFGHDSCYTCHADYGMFGTVLTKIGGMRHVYLHMTEFRTMSLDEAREKIHLVKPYPNNNCMQCHTTLAPQWNKVPDHASAREAVIAEKIGCSSRGCHGFAHPITKKEPKP